MGGYNSLRENAVLMAAAFYPHGGWKGASVDDGDLVGFLISILLSDSRIVEVSISSMPFDDKPARRMANLRRRERFAQDSPIAMDVMMPKQDGVAACGYILFDLLPIYEGADTGRSSSLMRML